VPRDVDVYAQPGGAGQPVGQLAGGSKVRLATKGEDHWCKVYGNGVPGGEGWVWCGIGDDGQDYALTEVPVEPAPAPAPLLSRGTAKTLDRMGDPRAGPPILS
jgi:hypothetical protein